MNVLQIISQVLIILGALGVFLSTSMYVLSNIIKELTLIAINKLTPRLSKYKVFTKIKKNTENNLKGDNFNMIKVFVSLCIVIFVIIFILGAFGIVIYNIWASHTQSMV